MQILELYIKNFGKFTEKQITFPEHIQVIYGENEYGKSTIYAFIKAMLFGLERGRGRAAGKDEFSRFEPWDNPRYYAGLMRFRCGGRTFRLERSFDRYTKNVSLICEDDGEELSVEAGDLEMLLGGMTMASFENTAAIGQLTARPGRELALELKNYAANYYETGSEDIDLQRAVEHIRSRKKQAEQEQKERLETYRKKQETLELQMRYAADEEERLRKELEEAQEKRDAQTKVFEQSKAAWYQDEVRKGKRWVAVGVILISAGMAGLLYGIGIGLGAGTGLSILAAVVLTAGVLCLGWSIFRQKRKRTEEVSESDAVRKLSWESSRIAEELREKRMQKENLMEQMRETDAEGAEEQNTCRKIRALELAEEKIKEAARDLVKGFGERLNREASGILEQITEGRYRRLLADENLNLAVLSEGKRIPAEKLSRGTIEQIYFSLRMAALNLLYEEEVPVIMDDAFVFYDEKRLKCVLKWLSEQSRQVIIFSCQTREKKLLASMEKWKDEIR